MLAAILFLYLFLIFKALQAFSLSTLIPNSKSGKIYVYEWPDIINRYANFSDRPHHSHGVEFPSWTNNYGVGRIISPNTSEYKTSQFALFKIMYERVLLDPRYSIILSIILVLVSFTIKNDYINFIIK